MTSRSKSRRTPHSSSGNIPFSSLPLEVQHPLKNHEYTHHNAHSNPSLPSLGSSSAGVSAQERIVKTLVDKLNAKLPCFSGLALSDVEVDESALQVIEALLQLSRHCINIIVWSLCEILDKLSKKHAVLETSLYVVDSEIYVVRVLITMLTFHWYTSAEERTSEVDETWMPILRLPMKNSDESLRSKQAFPLENPPALEDNVAKYALVAMLTFIRRCGPTKADSVRTNNRIDSLDVLHELDSFDMDTAVLHAARQLPIQAELNFGSSRSTYQASKSSIHHQHSGSVSSLASGSGASSLAVYVPSALAVRTSALPTLRPVILTHLAGKVIYRLSATNWPIVFSRIRNKIHYLAANMSEEGQDIIDLRLVTYSLIDQNRLVQVLQELSSLLVNMKAEAQGAVAVALRTVVWSWIEAFPEEFVEVVTSSRRRLDGQPERVFDLLYQLIDGGNRRLFWPTLAILVAVSPERLKSAEAALSGTLKYGKKHNNFLEQLHSALTTQSKLGETAVLCYNDICRAAFCIPQSVGDTVLRSLAPDLADELKSRLMNPPPPSRPFYDSVEPIDINLYADALVCILRYHPMMALVSVLPLCLEAERSSAVKLCVVRALTILVTEAPKFPWQSALDKSIYAFVAPKLRAAGVTALTPDVLASRPLSSKDRDVPPARPQDDRRDLLISIHTLWRLDIGFLLSSMSDDDYISFIEGSLVILQPGKDEALQISTLRTLGAILSRLNNALDEYADQIHTFVYHAAVPSIHAAAEGLLRVMDDLEENKRFMNVILAILSQLADRSMEGRQTWKFNEKRPTALAAVETALITTLTSPRLDIASLAARGLRLLAFVEQDPKAPPPDQYTFDQVMARVPLLEVMGDPKIVILGRVEFQKRARFTICPGAFPCITHLAEWRETYYRFVTLTPVVTGSAARSSSDAPSVESSNLVSSRSLTPEEKQMAWENYTLMLSASANCCTIDDPTLNPPSEYRIPFRYGISDDRPTELVKKFIKELLNLLINPWVPAQIIARDALGTEFSPQLFPILFEIFDLRIREVLESPGDVFTSPQQYKTLFVDQVISILKLTMDRTSDADTILIKADIGEDLQLLAGYIHQSQQRASELRMKSRFCALIDIILEKREVLRIRQEIAVRNNLLDIVADWIPPSSNELPEDEMARNEYLRASRDSSLAALKTCVNLLDHLRLQAYDGATPSDTSHVVSRLFHRYFNIFIGAVPQRQNDGYSTTIDYERVSQLSMPNEKHDALIQELVVSGIANMLHANADAGTKHVLSLGYKDSPRLRAMFAHIFCRVLSRGTKFDQVEGSALNNRNSKLCEMVRDSEIIAQAIIDVCPMSEIDTIVPVLLNIYDTRRTLMSLLKMIIQRQVDTTSSDTELFRSNDMCSRLLSAFARLHGYNYLRSILAPLIGLMKELPVERGYELDPSKLRPGQTQEENAENLQMISKAFLDVISDSIPVIPPLIREVCRYIENAVTAVWPESRYAAVGAFIFLRFIVPAIVAPESVDIEMPRTEPRASTMRRGLLLVAKIIQNLANNILFGKEAHMMMLNPFLEAHILPVTRFHNDIVKPIPNAPTPNPDEWLGTSYEETDTIVLHRFFQKHADKIGKVLLSLSRMTNSHEAVAASGKRTWDEVCALLVDMGAAMESPVLTDKPSSQHQAFRAFMTKNGNRNTDPVRDIFQSTMLLQDQRAVFILTLSKINVETVDLELLMCHIFKTLKDKRAFEQPFDVIIDCTAFTSASEVPISWCKLCLEHMPLDLRQRFDTAYILNSNPAAQKFLRKLYHVCSNVKFASSVVAVSSIAELATHVHPGSLTPMSFTTTLESETYSSYHCHQHIRNLLKIPIFMQVGISHIRLTSVKTQYVYPNLACKTVEIVPLVDIGDVSPVISRTDATEFVIRRIVNGNTISFSSPERDKIMETIRSAKNRLKAARPLIPAERSRLSDVSAALLNVGLLNVCDEDELLRGAAYDLLFAVCAYVNYESNPLVPLRGPFIPSNTAAFILPFSERLANFVPQLTLDLIAEFAVGFEKASTAQKITCLQYLNPWIKNLAKFANPINPLYECSSGRLKDCIRSLVDITVKFPDVYPNIQRAVWAELAKHDSLLLNIALEELMRAAIDGGLGSRRCEQVADTLIAMSSINVRARVLMKLRRVLAKASGKGTRSLSQSPSWSEISALARLALVAGYSSRLAVQTQLFVPEIAHLVTMLCATGALPVKTTVYGIAMNLIQSLHITRSEEERPAMELKRLLDQASHHDMLKKFGLVRAHPSSEYTSVEFPPDQISISALENITLLLIQTLTHGAQSNGLLNVWRGRWMSLVAATAFQVCPYIQYRAFVVLGLLASSDASEVDDDLLYQMLVAFKNALASSSAENDHAAVMSMLRCIARVIPGLNSDSRYLPQVFWLAVALLQSTYLPLYEESARLLEVTLEAMARQGFFKGRRMSIALLEARIPLSDITTQLDDIMGLSFDTGFSFSLASVIFRGIRPPALRPVARTLLKTVLRIAAESSVTQVPNSDDVPMPLDHDILGYFLALLPFACTSTSYRELLHESMVSTRWWPPLSSQGDGEDDSAMPTVSTELFNFEPGDNKTPLLVISFLFAMLNSYQGSEQEKEFVFGLLAQLAVSYPELSASAVVHYLTNTRSEWLLNNLTDTFVGSAETASAVQVLFRIAMTSPAWSAASSSTLSAHGEEGQSQRTPHYRALEDLDMHSLSGTWQFLPKGDASKVLQWIPQLVDAIIE
ncbi:hypothetical protein K439DRAFT_1626245 [Ramaria rubella]|nr:hypothetical protein K439DRAFT_1626245 [Ramaria rubella]